MPRTVDTPAAAAARGAGIASDHSPLFNLLNFQALDDTALQAGNIFITIIQDAVGQVFGIISSLTGINLTPIESLFTGALGGTTGTPTGTTVPGLNLSQYSSVFGGLFSPLSLISSLSGVIGIGNLGTVLPNILSFLGGGTTNFAATGGTFSTNTAATNFLNLILNPTGLLALLSGGFLSSGVIPGLDASKITSGTFGVGLLQPLINAISAGFGGASGLNFGGLTSLLAAIPGAQQVIDAIAAALGITGTGHTTTQLTSYLQNIPGLNIVTTLLASVIPGLDASKITSGTFANALVPGLGALMDTIVNALGTTGTGFGLSGVTTALTNIPGVNIVTALLSSVIPGLDASKITSGTFPQSMITGLLSTLGTLLPTNTFQSLIDAMYQAINGGTSTNNTVASIKTALLNIPGVNIVTSLLASVIPGLDASKIVSGTFGNSLVPGLGSIADYIYQAINGGSSTGNALSTIKTSLLNIPGANIVTSLLASVIPGLDASKIISGTFGNTLVPGLGSIADYIYQAINGGSSTGNALSTIKTSLLNIPGLNIVSSLLASVIPSLDASKITSGTFGLAFVPGLQNIADYIFQAVNGGSSTGNALSTIKTSLLNIPGANIVTSLLASVIPGLDATKITSGVFGASLIPNITAGMSTAIQSVVDNIYQAINGGASTGNTLASVKTALLNIPGANIVTSLLASVIPGLDATKIVSGILGLAQIPGLPAGQITSGVFGTGLIPGLDVAKIVSGVFGAGFIPGLDATKIVSGILSLTSIPGLPTSQITSGTFLSSIFPMFSAQTTAGSNLILSPQFEVNAAWTGAAGVMSTAQKHSGTQSRLLTATGAALPLRLINDDIGPKTVKSRAGEVFYVEGWVYPKTGNTGGGQLQAQVTATDSTGTNTATTVSASLVTVPATGAWAKVSGYATMPAGYDTADPAIALQSNIPIGDIIYIDDVLVRETTESATMKDTIANALGVAGAGKSFSTITTALGAIPGANIGSAVLAAVVPTLDASKIGTGTFADAFLPGLGAARDAIAQAMYGGSTTGYTAAQIKSGLLAIPGGNIATTILASVIPALDASKITTGAFAQTQLPTQTKATIPDLQSTIDQLFQGYTNTSVTGKAPSDLNASVGASINNRITKLEGSGTLTQYTSNATWTNPTPAAHNLITVIVINGGTGGAKASTVGVCGAAPGGAGGGYKSQQFYTDTDLPATVAMTIGAGGAGATASQTRGVAGGVTSFGTYLVGAPGLGSVIKKDGSFATSVPPGSGGFGAAVSNSSGTAWNNAGTDGQSGPFAPGGLVGLANVAGGNGGAAPAGVASGGGGGGGGGATGTAAGVGGNGGFPGGGGGGGGNWAQTGATNGGAGAAGCIYVIT